MLGRWSLTLRLTSPDLCIQGPGGLTLDSLPGFGTRERTLSRESGVGVSGFYLLAMNCVVLGKTLAGVCTYVSSPAWNPLTRLVQGCNGGNLDSGYYRWRT